MTRRTQTLPDAYFAGIYASDPDPWRFTSSPYERDKYAATLAALPRARYGAAFEPACSIGVFTRALSVRCDRLLAMDLVPSATAAARDRCADRPTVEIRQGTLPAAWPAARFDLIVLSEFLYFLAPPDFDAVVRRVEATIAPGGDLVLVHWLGETDYPLSGDAAAEDFIRLSGAFAHVLGQSRTAEYRIDVLRAGATS